MPRIRKKTKKRRKVVFRTMGNVKVTVTQQYFLEQLLDDILDARKRGESMAIKTQIWISSEYERNAIYALKRRKFIKYQWEDPGGWQDTCYWIQLTATGWRDIGLPLLQHVEEHKTLSTAAKQLVDFSSALCTVGQSILKIAGDPAEFRGFANRTDERLANKLRYARTQLNKCEAQYKLIKQTLSKPDAISMDELKAEIIAATLAG